MSEEAKSISVPVWAKCSFGMVRRGSLEPDHPLSTYSYVAHELCLNPDDFGISDNHPYDVDDKEA